jgi:hypothetical protein
MAKQLGSEAMTAADLKEYLQSNDDFAFEREIYHIANSYNIDTLEHAALYEDPLQQKQRQFDIRAGHTQVGGNKRIELAIECKRLKENYPLLVSCVPRSTREAFHDYLHTYERVNGGNIYTEAKSVHSGGPMSLYPAGLLVGKAMNQVGRELISKAISASDRDAFDKWAQALSSIAELLDARARQPVKRPYVEHVAFLPVLVVPDGTLWGAKYSTDGSLAEDPTQQSEISFYVGRKFSIGAPSADLTVTHLHICTRTAVSELLHQVTYGGGIWEQLFPH